MDRFWRNTIVCEPGDESPVLGKPDITIRLRDRLGLTQIRHSISMLNLPVWKVAPNIAGGFNCAKLLSVFAGLSCGSGRCARAPL